MGDAALNLAIRNASDAPSWPFKLAQQAFNALLEESRQHSGFRVGARRLAARSALSALSVDDRGPLERWLSLQLVTTEASETSASIGILATVDPMLGASVRQQMPRTVAWLSQRAPQSQLKA